MTVFFLITADTSKNAKPGTRLLAQKIHVDNMVIFLVKMPFLGNGFNETKYPFKIG